MVRSVRPLLIAIVAGAGLLLPGSASAAISSVLGGQTAGGGAIPCPAQSDGVRVCHGADNGGGTADLRLKSFDGIPLEIYVILPPASSGAAGKYPLIVQSHGYGNSAGGPSNTEFYGPTGDQLAKQGYAVLQLTARGFGDSCGSAASRAADPTGCASGYIRLDDDRYEVRDIQNAIGLLVDEGVVDPAKIGLTGESYGGGVSMQLATLKDRVMYPDGSIHPWTSPNGTPLKITAAAPVIPWSDLVYSLVPNGRTLDTQVTSPTADLSPVGVEKLSFVTGLYALGASSGFYAPPGVDPQADLTSWYAQIGAGEPYGSNVQSIVQQIAQYHSAYYLLDNAFGAGSEAPAPLLIANGFTDDLFPVDEAIRYANLEHSLYPTDPVSMFDGDFGHQAAQNKAGDKARLSAAIQTFFNYYLKGLGSRPATGVTAMVETCPATAASGGPFTASSWPALHPGSVNYASQQPQTISSSAGNPTIAKTIDPIAGGGACATVPAQDQGPGVATYRLPAASGSGYTLLGAPVLTANLQVTGSYPEMAARLWDVDPKTGQETLVTRGIYRPDPNNPSGSQTFQLHPGAWHFAAGHIPKLELLGQDSPYARPSNGTFQINVASLSLHLPVHEKLVSGPTGGVCRAAPIARIAKRRARLGRRRLLLTGTAREHNCTGAPRGRLARVYVIVLRSQRGGKCRFLTGRGRLSGSRSCSKPIELRARGKGKWTLRRNLRIPPGRYLIRIDAVDSRHRHSARTAAATMRVRVR